MKVELTKLGNFLMSSEKSRHLSAKRKRVIGRLTSLPIVHRRGTGLELLRVSGRRCTKLSFSTAMFQRKKYTPNLKKKNTMNRRKRLKNRQNKRLQLRKGQTSRGIKGGTR
jgi:hypothetical protein